ncbi:hypothetical protein [Streptomyces ficellus]|uniref:ATP-dependent DNA ligase n=1 Tax=Streptomyces ficellus TaxID=1977088 RepID=UPI00338D8F00
MLRPPVEPMLAQARETLPDPGVLPGGLAFEAKFDGYRCLLFTPAGPGVPVLLQSRRGSLIQQHFPDLVTAAAQLPYGLVLDGELVVWSEGRLSFEALQRRVPPAAAQPSSSPARCPPTSSPSTSFRSTVANCSSSRTTAAAPYCRTCSPSTS